MDNKGRKTTIGAIVAGLLGLVVFAMWYLQKIETSELAVGLAAVGIFSNMVVGYFAKDQTATHTTDRQLTVDPDKEEVPDERG